MRGEEAPMIERESTGDGWQAPLVIPPAMQLIRLVPAAFLSFWLCGWAAGEFFAGSALLTGLRDQFAPGVALPFATRFASLPVRQAPWILAFLGVWFTGWTFGGLFAVRALLTVALGRFALRWSARGPELVTIVGPWSSAKPLTWEQVDRALDPAAAVPPMVARVQGRSGPSINLLDKIIDQADRETLRGWLREARAESAEAPPPPMQAIG
jgi:hypothetical protein